VDGPVLGIIEEDELVAEFVLLGNLLVDVEGSK
jgi:hypothetical protein